MAMALSLSRLASSQLRTLIRRRLAGLGAMALAAAAVVLLAVLATYDAQDPSLNTATARTARNLFGAPGAAAADLLLQGFGAAAVLPGLALLAWAWRLGVGGHGGGRGSALWRVVALLAAMPVLSAALSAATVLLAVSPHWPAAAGPGGAAGLIVSADAMAAGRGLMGQAGGAVVWGMLSLLALVLSLLALGLSLAEWRAAVRLVGRVVRRVRYIVAWAAYLVRRLAWAGAWVINRVNGSGGAAAPVAVAQGRAEPAIVIPRAPEPAAPPPRPPNAAGVVAEAEAPRAAVKAPPVRPAPPRKLPAPRQVELPLETGTWKLPPLALLTPPPMRAASGPTSEALQGTARQLESVLSDYGVQGQIVAIRPGPVVTLYELEPAPGIRSARVIGLADDVARSLSVTAVRIATVPGRNVIGIEVPNSKRETVYLSELINTPEWEEQGGRLALALGKDIGGAPVIADLARMPHLLVAGTTGSGKSVGINAMILSLLYKMSPDQCRLILIDPKMLELSVYEGIPHLMAPVVTEPAKAVVALKWTVREMERRYRAMSGLSVRNIGGYNDRVTDARARGEVVTRRVQTGFDSETGKPIFEDQPLALETLPLIVVVIDEMADLMMVAGKEIEAAVQRLAQMARAAGIHVVMATQRPSVDVITGTIKANFPTRISFQVISKFDSRTILGEQGSEQLLGMGDMLYMAGGGRITRVHGPFVTDREVEEIVAYLREQGEPDYLDEVTEPPENGDEPLALGGIGGGSDDDKSLFDQAVAVVARDGKASTSYIQRKLAIGYNKAARLVEQMETEGIVGPASPTGKREILVRRTQDED
ncbi:MAG: DNA translocase FtsK 4TM domain-containing protein [Acetobacteraceae bacterium]|nr:DNA translocase FtsK 4TM domain-containing protein [Acetobacteraceae bacterium]